MVNSEAVATPVHMIPSLAHAFLWYRDWVRSHGAEISNPRCQLPSCREAADVLGVSKSTAATARLMVVRECGHTT